MADTDTAAIKGMKDYFKTSAEFRTKLALGRELAEKRGDEEAKAFLKDFEERFERYGSKTRISEKQYQLFSSISSWRAEDWFDDDASFGELLAAAEEMAADDWSTKFVSEQKNAYERYGLKMRLSEKQKERLERIASGAAAAEEVETEW